MVEMLMRRVMEMVAAARSVEAVVGVVGGLPISVLRMTTVGCGSSSRRGSRGGLPRLGHHVFVVYLHHPENSHVVPASEQDHTYFFVCLIMLS
jgi:hypothetical protein